jgi:pimeloyl-ACP methyl ester carboxylesterase
MTESACQIPIPADLAAPAEGQMIAVNGAEIYFEVYGQGEPLLATILARALIVHGDRGSFFPVEIALEMYRAIPRSYLWVIPHSSHGLPAYLHQAFLDTVLPFLRGDWVQE